MIELGDEAATERFGAALGAMLEPGDVLGLEGRLGAGKTFLARHVLWGAGVPGDEAVTSPTFALVQEYDGRFPIAHADLYRLGSSDELCELGIEERMQAPWVLVVEWGRKHAEALNVDLWLTMEIVSDTSRRAVLEPITPRGKAIAAGMLAVEV